jgi:hypothetical protein
MQSFQPPRRNKVVTDLLRELYADAVEVEKKRVAAEMERERQTLLDRKIEAHQRKQNRFKGKR